MAGGIKPGQVPDWRPGAEFWKPLADGREVTVYPLLHGKGRLCVGPLADPNGYDIAYRYESVAAAVKAGQEWDGESSENPPDFEKIEFGEDLHPGTIANPTENPIPQPGEYVAPMPRDGISLSQEDDGAVLMRLRRVIGDGRTVSISGEKKVRTDGVMLCEVHSVEVSPASPSGNRYLLNRPVEYWRSEPQNPSVKGGITARRVHPESDAGR